MTRAANTFTVLANGNNAVVATDMVRRTIECRLDANMESPETRVFRDDPLAPKSGATAVPASPPSSR